jgi:hypothetical protein
MSVGDHNFWKCSVRIQNSLSPHRWTLPIKNLTHKNDPFQNTAFVAASKVGNIVSQFNQYRHEKGYSCLDSHHTEMMRIAAQTYTYDVKHSTNPLKPHTQQGKFCYLHVTEETEAQSN